MTALPAWRKFAVSSSRRKEGSGTRDRRRRITGTAGLARLDDGTVVDNLRQFDALLGDGMSFALGLVRLPVSLAFLLEAAGAVALERCGAILEERIQAADAAAAEDGAVS